MLRRLSGWAAIAALAATIAFPIIALALDRLTGVEGWEMASVDQEMLAMAQESPDRETFLGNFGFSESDPIGEQLSLIGRTGPFTQAGKTTRFVLVPDDRHYSSPFGVLVVFDRSASEELMQARSLRNITIIATLSAAGMTILLGGIWWWLRRRRPATDGNLIDGDTRR